MCQGLKKNVISISTITNQDLKVKFLKSSCLVNDKQDHYKVIVEGIKVGGLYKFDVTIKGHQALSSTIMST
jgi:hypothetical protein